MGDSERFPKLRPEDIIKISIGKDESFPDLRAGDVVKISPVDDDDLNDVDVGQFVVIQRSRGQDGDFTLRLTDEAKAMSSRSDEVGARVSYVEDLAVTLEITSALEDGDG